MKSNTKWLGFAAVVIVLAMAVVLGTATLAWRSMHKSSRPVPKLPPVKLLAAEPAANAPAETPVNTAQDQAMTELETDKLHMRQIYTAIQAYQKKHGDLPDWLSDLYPEFLPNVDVLTSPLELRTGRSMMHGQADPRRRTSYVYEFSNRPSGISRKGRELTMKEKKLTQMEEFGPVVPLLRCHLYGQVINLSYSGEFYQTGTFWETDRATWSLMTQLGAGPGAKDSKIMVVTVMDADTGQPLDGVEVQASNRVGMGLRLPPRTVMTNSRGQCKVNLGDENPKTVTLDISRDGYVAWHERWTKGDMPADYNVKLEKATAPVSR
ncbi:MAG: hypothetical protein JWR26_2369 [Pedosphaera sp.]|nr:hypothetical protein [Pedosphaera sp.]